MNDSKASDGASTNQDGGPRGDTESPIHARIPERRPDRMWGGRGLGIECVLCGEPVCADETELELEFERGDDKQSYHVHVSCFRAWEVERAQSPAPAAQLLSGEDNCGSSRPRGFDGSSGSKQG